MLEMRVTGLAKNTCAVASKRDGLLAGLPSEVSTREEVLDAKSSADPPRNRVFTTVRLCIAKDAARVWLRVRQALRSQAMRKHDHDGEPTQKTQPKKGKPVEIPVPKRSEFDKLLDKAQRPRKSRKPV
jgi:hypothetical protein